MKSQIEAFLKDYTGVYAPSTLAGLTRRYNKMSRDFVELQKAGLILGSDFSDLSPEDVKNYGVSLRNRGLKQNAIIHELSALGSLSRYCGCNAYDLSKARYPLIFYTPNAHRLPPLKVPEIERLIIALDSLKGVPFHILRAGASVALALGAGLRPVEIQHLQANGLDLINGLVTVETVKGGATYGQARTVPIRRAVLPFLVQFMARRALAPPTVARSQYVICNPSDGLPLVSNTLRVDKARIEALAGVKFDYRKLRRTYAQLAIDEGANLASVSLVLGHATTKTTESTYGRMRPDVAIDDIISRW
jgi:site-specific recombinase XerD